MKKLRQRSFLLLSKTQSGFSLVEILVGLVIGMLATMVIMQVFSAFEGQKRTTTGTADAQTNGNIALYNLQREIQRTGYGLPVTDDENKPLLVTNFQPAGYSNSPVIITDGGVGAGASDTISVRYGATSTGGIPEKVLSLDTAVTDAASVVRAGVDNNMSCAVGHVVMVCGKNSANVQTCRFSKVTGPSDIAIPPNPINPALPDTKHIELQDDVATSFSAGGIGTLAGGGGAVVGKSITCTGGWTQSVLAVNNNQLERDGLPIVAEIVNMQAQYGVVDAGALVSADKTDDNKIVQWVDATGPTWGAAMTIADRNRIKAVRVAIVARNNLLEKDNVTQPCSSLSAANPTGLCAWDATSATPAVASPAPKVDLSKNQDGTANPDWQRYRYRVFETIIPIRNMVWSKDAIK